MKTYVQVITAITQEQINQTVAKAQAKVEECRKKYDQACAQIINEFGDFGKANLVDFEAGKLTEVGWTPLNRTGVATAWRELRQAERDLQMAKQIKPRNASIRLVAIDSYAVKDELKARGWRFDRDAYWHDMLGSKTTAGWVRTFPVANQDDAAAVVAEIQWCKTKGPVEGDDILTQIGINLAAMF